MFWLNVVLWIVGGVWFFRTQHNKPFAKLIMWSVLLKALATVAFVYLHQKLYPHYLPDYQLIFEDACKLSDFIHQNSLEYLKILFSAPEETENWYLASQERAFFAVKLYSILVWIAEKNFWLSVLYASGAVLMALWWLSRTLIRLFPTYRNATLISFIFLPSLMFWASATSKESLLMIFLSILTVISLKTIYQKWNWWRLPIFLGVSYWLLLLKYYYAFGFIFAVCLYVWLFFIRKFNVFTKIVFTCASLIIIWGATHLHPNLQIYHFAEALYNNYALILQASPKGSAIDLGLSPTWQSLLVCSPVGLWIGLFAPLPHQISKWQMLPIAIENLLVLLLVGLFLWQAIKMKVCNKISLQSKSVILWICLWGFILVMATFLGLSSPNFGAISRYKIGFLPFLVFSLLVFIQELRSNDKQKNL